jgi:hypothetical protein
LYLGCRSSRTFQICVDISTSSIKIEEQFVEFLKVDDTTEKCLFNEIINVLKNILNLILMIYEDKDIGDNIVYHSHPE